MSDILAQFFAYVIITVVGILVIGYGIDSYATWLKKHKRLTVHIRKLDDGRYQVRYYWGFWETPHREYIDADILPYFLEEIARSI